MCFLMILGNNKDDNQINSINIIKMGNKDIIEEINTKDNIELLYKLIKRKKVWQQVLQF